MDLLWCVGPDARHVQEGAVAAGLDPSRAFWSATAEDAMEAPQVLPRRGDVVLVKASRGMRLERLAETLRRPLRVSRTGAAPDGGIRKVG